MNWKLHIKSKGGYEDKNERLCSDNTSHRIRAKYNQPAITYETRPDMAPLVDLIFNGTIVLKLVEAGAT